MSNIDESSNNSQLDRKAMQREILARIAYHRTTNEQLRDILTYIDTLLGLQKIGT